MQVIIDRNYVTILNTRIDRPSFMAPNQWLEFWRPLDSKHQDAIDYTNSKKKADHLDLVNFPADEH